MNRKKTKPKILIILGPTATGKTKLAVKLARKFNGEIVSADSRQVYKGMDIGTGKDIHEFKVKSQKSKVKIIPYHLIDVVSPKADFNVAKFQKLAYKAIDDILSRGKLPIVVGGTGLYISAIVDGIAFGESKACPERSRRVKSQKSKVIRKKLGKLSLKQLLVRLKKVDIKTYKIIDKKNRRRVQRALEIYYETGLPKSQQQKKQPRYNCLQIGILPPQPPLSGGRRNDSPLLGGRRNDSPLLGGARGGVQIANRLNQRLRGGALIKEVKNLHNKQKVSWKRLENFGLEYKWVSYYLQGKLNYQEMKEGLTRDIKKFAKRQMTWFKRDERIVWESDYQKIFKLIQNFYNADKA
jgi:tRNA dimethylallyltransferase